MQPFDSSRTITFTIADLRLRIQSEDARIIAGLASWYRDFLATPAAQAFPVTIQWQESSALASPGTPEVEVAFQGDALCFRHPDYQGTIDIAGGEATLALRSASPLEPVDYFVRNVVALLALHRGGLLFHSAGIVRDGRCYLFFGYSGSGKTTVCRNSPDDLILNDDLVLLLPAGERWLVYATPFSNPTQVQPGGPRHAPLDSLYRLVQDTRVFAERLPAAHALAQVLASVPVVSTHPGNSALLIARLMDLLRAAPCYRLHFLPDGSFWNAVRPHDP